MRQRRLLAVVGFNLLLFLVLIELTGLVDYFLKTGTLYYASPPRSEALREARELARQTEAYRLHPYFGFIAVPDTSLGEIETNNYGFYSFHDYPYAPRSARELVVGLFGGSVAAKLELFERRRGLLGDRLAAVFGRDSSEVTILSFAQGGFKQPQQLLIYSYFRALGQRFDVVLNIDGFNEIALTDHNLQVGAAADMPSMAHISGLQQVVGTVFRGRADTGYLEAMLRVREAYRKYVNRHDRMASEDAWELSFAGGFFLDRKLAKLYRKRFHAALAAYGQMHDSLNEDSWLYVNPLGGLQAPDGVAATIELWASASSMMHAQQSQHRGAYFHFLQPNQYYPTGRVYGGHERTVALNDRSPYADPVRLGYPPLRKELGRLQARGVPVHDLSELFDDLAAEAYADDCCHYTDAGQEALATAIGDIVAAASGAP